MQQKVLNYGVQYQITANSFQAIKNDWLMEKIHLQEH